MKLPLYWIDAFTTKIFHGNPAAVIPLEHWPADEMMQQVAFENGLAETAFFVRTAPARFHLRWFTPTIEIDLCGHATLATAFTLFTQLNQSGDVVTFDSRSGPLTVRRDGTVLELDFPSRPARETTASEELLSGLKTKPEFVAQTKVNWLCVYSSAAHVLELQPDHALLAQAAPGRIIVTAPGEDCDFVSRFFAPDAGISEDPVTGSAHTTLIPYWAERLGKTKLHARQVSARSGELFCELRGDRVGIAGHAILYLKGEIQL